MRVICFGRPDPALVAALEAEGCELEFQEPPGAEAGDGPAQLAAAFRRAEAALEESPAAALVAGTEDAALAAAITAVKLGAPTAWLGDTGGEVPLVARVAELSLGATADAAESARAIRELAESKIPSP